MGRPIYLGFLTHDGLVVLVMGPVPLEDEKNQQAWD